jgi:transglutaminase-like putative cysteine protease
MMISLSRYGWLAALLLSMAVVAAEKPEAVVAAIDDLPELKLGPEPSWVESVEWQPSKASHPGFPGEVLLSDSQGMLRRDGNDYYYRYVVRILNREGVQQNAEQSVTFSPEYERVVWHSLRIHRGEAVIDQLPKVKFKRLQRELGLEGKVYDGRVTAVAVLEDVRVGDVLDVAYTRFNTNPLYRDRPSFRMSLGSSYPTKRQRVVVRLPTDLPPMHWYFFQPPETRGLPEEIFSAAALRRALRETSTETERVVRWEAEEIAGIPFDGGISGEAAPYYPSIRCSTFSWWNDVVDWALPLFETDEPVPTEVEALIASWRKLPRPLDRLRAAVDWVQGDVRYFSMAFGQQNVKPRPLAEICGTRFGDCKDKSVVLARILRALEIPAWPALVNTYSEHLVRQGGPDVHAFNHAIVAYELDGQLRWIDPTLRQPAGSPGDWELPLGYSPALIIRKGEAALTEVPAPHPTRFDSETVDRVRIDSATGDAELSTSVTLHGIQADFYRMSLEEVTDEQRAKNWYNYLARFYPQLEEVSPPKVTDDRALNRVTLQARYRLPRTIRTEENTRFASFYAYALRSLVETPESRRRHWPLGLPFGRAIRHRIEVELPEDVPTFVRPITIRTREFDFRGDRSGTGRSVSAEYQLRFAGRSVAPDRMAVFADSIGEMLNEMTVFIRFDSGRPPEPKSPGQ